MKTIIKLKRDFSLIEFLSDISKVRKLKYDFSDIIYITPDWARAEQLKDKLIIEMRDKKINSILMPDILSYKQGFLVLALLAKYGDYDENKMPIFTEDWIEFLMYEISWQTIVSDFAFDPYNEKTNKVASLSRDFKSFLYLLVLELKKEKLNELKENQNNLDDIEKFFINAYEKYTQIYENFKKDNDRFFTPLAAYEELYDMIKNKNYKDFNKIIIVENLGLLEPLMQKIIDELKEQVYVIEFYENEQKSEKFLYNFLTTVDEAEYVGYKIKKLLSEGINDIAVVCCNSEIRDILDVVFDRFAIDRSNEIKYKEIESYINFKTVVDVVCNKVNDYKILFNLFESNQSKFCLDNRKIYYKLMEKIVLQGKKIHNNPIKQMIILAINDVFNELNNKDKEKLSVLKSILETNDIKNLDFVDVFNKTVKYDKNDSDFQLKLINAIKEMQEILDKFKSKDEKEYIKSIEVLLKIIGERDYFLIKKYKKDKDKSDDWGESENPYFIPVMSPQNAEAINAKYVFICGLTAEFDKRDKILMPLTLAEKMQLETPEIKREKKIKSLINLMENCKNCEISYGYLDVNSKEAGQAILVKVLLNQLKRENIKINDDGGLLTINDAMNFYKTNNSNEKIEVPDISFCFSENSKSEEINFRDIYNRIYGDRKMKNVVDDCLKKENDKKIIDVTTFCEFIECPRKFVFNLIANKYNLTKKDEQSIINMSKGTFWHNVFKIAAGKDGFNESNENRIEQALKEAYEEAIKNTDKEIFIDKNEDIDTKLKLFAKRELKRKKIENKSMKVVEVEKEIMHNISNEYILKGKIDRIDISLEKDFLIVWDYKTGKKKNRKIKFITEKNKTGKIVFNNEHLKNASQLLIYIYLLKENNYIIDKNVNVNAGNIFIDGSDNFNEKAKISLDLINETIEDFFKFLNYDFKKIEKREITNISTTDEKKINNFGSCSHCDYFTYCKYFNFEVNTDVEIG
jgi:hypothetical protein